MQIKYEYTKSQFAVKIVSMTSGQLAHLKKMDVELNWECRNRWRDWWSIIIYQIENITSTKEGYEKRLKDRKLGLEEYIIEEKGIDPKMI